MWHFSLCVLFMSVCLSSFPTFSFHSVTSNYPFHYTLCMLLIKCIYIFLCTYLSPIMLGRWKTKLFLGVFVFPGSGTVPGQDLKALCVLHQPRKSMWYVVYRNTNLGLSYSFSHVLLTGSPWTSYLTFLRLSFLIVKLDDKKNRINSLNCLENLMLTLLQLHRAALGARKHTINISSFYYNLIVK